MPETLPPETVEWLKTAHRCEVCWPLADAIAALEPKGYPRGEVDYRIRTELEYPRTPAQRAIEVEAGPKLEERKAQLESEVREQHAVEAGHEIPIETLVKRTKEGAWSTQSTAGKLVTVLEELSVPYKAGESRYFSGDLVKPVNIKREGRKTPVTIDYAIKPGEVKVHRWIDFPFRGTRATLVQSTVTWNGTEWKWDDFRKVLLGEEEA